MPRAGAAIAFAIRAGLALAAIVPGPATAAPEFQGHLTGIVIAATLREAIFIEDGATRRLHPGDMIEGWTLASVEPDAVTLTADGATTRLSPARAPAAVSPQAPAPVLRTHQVGDALARQQRDQARAEAAMTAATAKLEAEKAAHRGNRTP
jgi:type II secretory pathway component PulC